MPHLLHTRAVGRSQEERRAVEIEAVVGARWVVESEDEDCDEWGEDGDEGLDLDLEDRVDEARNLLDGLSVFWLATGKNGVTCSSLAGLSFQRGS